MKKNKSTLQLFAEGQEQRDYIHEILLHDYADLTPFVDLSKLVNYVQNKMNKVAEERHDALQNEIDKIKESANLLGVDEEKVLDSYIIFNLIVENAVLLNQLQSMLNDISPIVPKE